MCSAVPPIKDFSVFYSRARSLAQFRQAKWPRVSHEVQGEIEKTKKNCDKLLLENLRFHGEEKLTIQIHENACLLLLQMFVSVMSLACSLLIQQLCTCCIK
jgi:3-phosphoglycerate kinase